MAYVKTTWTNGATALSAEHMNNIEDGIAALDTGKVDKEVGKGLSTNDYTTEEKEKLVSLDSTKVDKVDGKGLSTNDYTTEEKTKLSGIETGAEVNQNAFGNVKVGSTTIAADGKTDTLELVAGTGITLTPDVTNDKVTIANESSIRKSTLNETVSVTIPAGDRADVTFPTGLSSVNAYIGIADFYFLGTLGSSQTNTSIPLSIERILPVTSNGVPSLSVGLRNNDSNSANLTEIHITILYLQ